MELTCEALGIKPEEIQEKVVDRLVQRLLNDEYTDEYGNPDYADSEYMVKLKDLVKCRIDSKVGELAEKHILPNVENYIEELTLQKTNKWGEKCGESISFIEYLTKQAEKYLTETVDYHGKTKSEGGYGWSGKTTRITNMVDKHLHYSIETAMKNAIKDLNSSVAKGLNEAVRLSINKAVSKLNANENLV